MKAGNALFELEWCAKFVTDPTTGETDWDSITWETRNFRTAEAARRAAAKITAECIGTAQIRRKVAVESPIPGILDWEYDGTLEEVPVAFIDHDTGMRTPA